MNSPIVATTMSLSRMVIQPAVPNQTPHDAMLKVDISNLKDVGGTLYISVQSRENYQSMRQDAGTIIHQPKAGELQLSYPLAKGEYTVSIWHDINDNRQFDLDENYIPFDGWSAPDAENLRSVPDFDRVKFKLDQGDNEIALKMIYPKHMQ